MDEKAKVAVNFFSEVQLYSTSSRTGSDRLTIDFSHTHRGGLQEYCTIFTPRRYRPLRQLHLNLFSL